MKKVKKEIIKKEKKGNRKSKRMRITKYLRKKDIHKGKKNKIIQQRNHKNKLIL